jgi:adenylosuccinate lyase
MENVALWHERDISHSSAERVILPDACFLLDYSLSIFTSVMKGLLVYPKNMKRNLELTKGLVFSQRVLLAFVEKGLSRQNSYKIVQRNAMKSWKGGRNFLTLLKSDKEVTKHLSEVELDKLFDYDYYLRHVDEIFERLGLTESQWQDAISKFESDELVPKSI